MDTLVEDQIKCLSTISDFNLIVLQGHLFAEEHLSQILSYSFPDKDKLSKLNLSFFEKTVLANALRWKKVGDDIWLFTYALNDLKNDFVNHTDIQTKDKKLKEFLNQHLCLYIDDEDKQGMTNMTLKEKLILSIGVILGFLNTFLKDVKKKYDYFNRLLNNEGEFLIDLSN